MPMAARVKCLLSLATLKLCISYLLEEPLG
jgi:hypothetical protein